MDWFYCEDNAAIGPKSEADMALLLRDRLIGAKTLVWRYGMQNWAPLQDSSELADALAKLPPPLPNQIKQLSSLPDSAVVTAAVNHEVSVEHRPPPAASLTGPTISETLPPSISQQPNTEELHRHLEGGPWSRYFARTLDVIIWGLVAFVAIIALALAPGKVTPFVLQLAQTSAEGWGFILLCMGAIINAVVTSVFGKSIGKSVFGLSVHRKHLLERENAAWRLAREVRVWVFGMGMGLPILTLVTNYMNYRRVSKGMPARYDRDNATVTARPISRTRRALAMVSTITVLTLVTIVGSTVGNPGALLDTHITTLSSISESSGFSSEASLMQPRVAAASTHWTNPVTQKAIELPAGWQHEYSMVGNTRVDTFTNVYTRVTGYIYLDTVPSSLEQHKAKLTKALASSTPLGAWTPAGLNIPMSKASGQSTTQRWPTTVYVTQVPGNMFWQIVYSDYAKSTAQDVGDTELTMALMSTVR